MAKTHTIALELSALRQHE